MWSVCAVGTGDLGGVLSPVNPANRGAERGVVSGQIHSCDTFDRSGRRIVDTSIRVRVIERYDPAEATSACASASVHMIVVSVVRVPWGM